MNQLHVVTGAGPVGSTIALQLADQGHRVAVLTRSGGGPDHPLIERRRVDVSNGDGLADAIAGAGAVYHCIHGSKYAADTWRAELIPAERAILDAARRSGAVVVFPESLYSYGEVGRPDHRGPPPHRGPRQARRPCRAAPRSCRVGDADGERRASDFLGPRVRNSHAGERMVPTILAGKTMRVVGRLDLPHSFTYVPDLAAAMIAAPPTSRCGTRCCTHRPARPSPSGRWSRRTPRPPAFRSRRSAPCPPGSAAAGWSRGAASWRRCGTSSRSRS